MKSRLSNGSKSRPSIYDRLPEHDRLIIIYVCAEIFVQQIDVIDMKIHSLKY